MNKTVKEGLTKNKLELIWLRSLSGAGKSTWAREQQNKHPGKYKLISKDDIRLMLDQGEWSSQNEKFVVKIEEQIIRQALKDGYSVIVHNTHLHSKYKKHYRDLGAEFSAKVICHDLTDVPLDECIKRDLKRLHSVGEAVIRKQYRDFLEPPAKIYHQYPELENCILVDLDGTVALNTGGRSPYDWKRVGEDEPNWPVIKMIQSYLMSNNTKLIFMSGRDEVCRKETEEWLRKYFSDWHALYMRPQNNTEKDSIIKERLFMNWINGRFNCIGIFDDRLQVCKMWRSLGLQVYQVAEGDF